MNQLFSWEHCFAEDSVMIFEGVKLNQPIKAYPAGTEFSGVILDFESDEVQFQQQGVTVLKMFFKATFEER